MAWDNRHQFFLNFWNVLQSVKLAWYHLKVKPYVPTILPYPGCGQEANSFHLREKGLPWSVSSVVQQVIIKITVQVQHAVVTAKKLMWILCSDNGICFFLKKYWWIGTTRKFFLGEVSCPCAVHTTRQVLCLSSRPPSFPSSLNLQYFLYYAHCNYISTLVPKESVRFRNRTGLCLGKGFLLTK